MSIDRLYAYFGPAASCAPEGSAIFRLRRLST